MSSRCAMMCRNNVMGVTATLELSQDWFKVSPITSGISADEAHIFEISDE
ncbi:hypothetical protein [Kosakonia sp.]|nr:hypothetical protein [Kosakonia sp.]